MHLSSGLHRNGAPLPSAVNTSNAPSASCRRLLSIAIRLRVKRLVSLSITDHTWTLVRKSCKRQSLAHAQNFSAVNFIPKEWVLRGISRCPIGWSQRLGQTDIAQDCGQGQYMNTHLCRNIRVEVPGV